MVFNDAMTVYFLVAPSLSLVKIGYATDLQRRIGKLAPHLPVDTVLWRSVPGTLRDEYALHRRFAEHRVRGEWFAFSPISYAIATLQAGETPHPKACPDCGQIRSRQAKGRAVRCRACAAKHRATEVRRRCVCIECGVPVSVISKQKLGVKWTGRCRPCAMRGNHNAKRRTPPLTVVGV